MFDWLIVGAGFAGSVLAERLASQLGDRVLLIDRRCHAGGNAYDRFDETGALVASYGQHVLQTNDSRVLQYLSQFTSWRPYLPLYGESGSPLQLPGSGVAIVDGSFSDAAPELPYAHSRADNRLPGFAAGAPGTGFAGSPLAAGEHLVGQPLVPSQGYARMFERMLSDQNIKLMLNVEYSEIRNIIPFRRLIYTGSIDEYFDYCYGKLPYRPVTAEERGFPLGESGGDDLFRRYEELARASTDVFFIGRLATYKYFAMGEVVAQALETFARIQAAEDDPERHTTTWSNLPTVSV